MRKVTRLLERVMGTEVRDDNIQAKRDSISNLISSSYSESEVQIIETLVAGLVRPNTFYNEELTRQAEDQAAQSVVAEIRSFAQGQMIIRAGEIASSADIEALDKFGLLEASDRQENLLVGSFVIMGMATLMLGLYSWQFNPAVYEDPPLLVLLCVVFLVFLAAAQLIGADGAVRQYYFPASAMVFLVATIVDKQLAIVMGISLAALVGFMADDSLEFASVIGLSGSIGVLALGRTERLNSYFFAGGVVGLANIVVAILFALTGTESNNYFILASQILGGIVNGGFSAALALVGLYLVTNLMNIPTSLKIVELMQPNHPLLVRLLREAPGTYQHSLQVANLAELGGQQINANASLLRVAAMYHDIGKILNPHFFVENQADGVNPHDALGDPSQSARIIIGHVTEGDRLARRHRLPTRIREFITEHHGTTQVVYFYRQALSAAENDEGVVDIREFTYPGPRPQTRETAILMLADGCESSVRSRRPQSKHDIQETVDYIFDTRLREGQLDESGLTLNDLHTLRDTFLTALQGIFHPRIAYPGSPGEKSNALPPGNASTLPEKASSLAASVAEGKNAEDDGTGSSEESAKPAGTKSSDREAASLPQEPLA